MKHLHKFFHKEISLDKSCLAKVLYKWLLSSKKLEGIAPVEKYCDWNQNLMAIQGMF
jgi:hypothetical protein